MAMPFQWLRRFKVSCADARFNGLRPFLVSSSTFNVQCSWGQRFVASQWFAPNEILHVLFNIVWSRLTEEKAKDQQKIGLTEDQSNRPPACKPVSLLIISSWINVYKTAITIVKFTVKSILATSNFARLFPLYFYVCNSISIFGIFNIYNVNNINEWLN